MTPEEIQKMNERAARKAELLSLSPITFTELESRVKRWMLLADSGVIKFLCAVYIANHLERDPIWIFLVGPSGGGKTELMTSLFDLEDIYVVSLLTPTTFLSGMPGKNDASLLPQISGKILMFLDWTNLLDMNKDAKKEIMGQLRDIYGGYLRKAFGNGKVREWSGKVGLMACTTSMVDFSQQASGAMGERFINYRVLMPDRKDVARRALDNGDRQAEMRKDLKDAMYSFFKGLTIDKENPPELPTEINEELVRVANFATLARSCVIRDFGFKKEVMFVPSAEMPTRITQQLKTIAISLMIVNGGTYMPSDMEIIYKIALDSIPQTNRIVIRQMAKMDNQTTKEIATALGYPTGPIHMYLENLAMLGVCRRSAGRETEEGGQADRWALKEDFSDIFNRHNDDLDTSEQAPEQGAIIPFGDAPGKRVVVHEVNIFDIET